MEFLKDKLNPDTKKIKLINGNLKSLIGLNLKMKPKCITNLAIY